MSQQHGPGFVPFVSGIPEGITRDDVLGAIEEFERGVDHPFGPSTLYDLIHEETPYPPKAIMGLAARRLAGRLLQPTEFTGGEASRCFKVLRSLGFTVKPKKEKAKPVIKKERTWVISLGESGRLFDHCYKNGIIAIGAGGLTNLEEFPDRDSMHDKLIELRGTETKPTNDSLAAWQFANEMSIGDSVIAKIGRDRLLGCAKVVSEYRFDPDQPDYSHVRGVHWLSKTPFTVAKRARVPTKTLTEVTNYTSFQEAIQSVYPELGERNSVELRTLPESPATSVWIEMTRSDHKHGGEGWEFGTCLWSPSKASDGKDWYRLMREAKTGDIVIHVNDSVIAGYSVVENPCRETNDEPPNAGAWSGMAPYYRVDLKGYQPFERPVKLGDFIRENKELIADELSDKRPFRYPFQLEASGLVKVVQGGYLNKCTPRLYAAIRDSVSDKAANTEKTYPSFTIEQATDGVFLPVPDFEEMVDCLRRKKNVVLQGPPGVGKTFIAKRLAYALLGVKDPTRVEMVQFHQSYTYEDFIQGWRPATAGGFELRNGVFHSFCEAAKDGRPHVFVIDEINRGNLSRIFGELMMLIEADKRGDEFSIPLTYSQDREERFFVPEGIHIIGLMNTADRSLAMVDYALRRRFTFVDLKPQFESSRFEKHLEELGAEASLISSIVERLSDLNTTIAEDTKNLGPGFAIGHSFFCPPSSDVAIDEDWYTSVIQTEIAPLLREYWFDDLTQAEALIAGLT